MFKHIPDSRDITSLHRLYTATSFFHFMYPRAGSRKERIVEENQ